MEIRKFFYEGRLKVNSESLPSVSRTNPPVLDQTVVRSSTMLDMELGSELQVCKGKPLLVSTQNNLLIIYVLPIAF